VGFFEIVKIIKGFLTAPVPSFREAKEYSVKDSLEYFLGILVFFAVLSTITVSLLPDILVNIPVDPGSTALEMVFLATVVILALLLTLFILAGLLHLFVYLFGGRERYTETVKVVIFGSTPFMLIGWIPMFGLVIGGLWSIILFIIGVRELHGITTMRAIGAGIFFTLVVVIGLFLIAVMIFTMFPLTVTSIYL
jgi:hypothetical protein